MAHRNAALTPEGRRRLCQRVDLAGRSVTSPAWPGERWPSGMPYGRPAERVTPPGGSAPSGG